MIKYNLFLKGYCSAAIHNKRILGLRILIRATKPHLQNKVQSKYLGWGCSSGHGTSAQQAQSHVFDP